MFKKQNTITIPEDLFDKTEKRAKDAGFDSVSEYIIFVLKEVVSSDEKEDEKSFSKEDEEKVKKRLKALGYLE